MSKRPTTCQRCNALVKACVGLERSFYGGPEPEYIDPWGIRWRYVKNDFGVFSVVRRGLASGGCVRITPQVFNTPDEIGRLADALKKLAA